MLEKEIPVCETCNHPIELHKFGRCHGNDGMERAYWAPFNALPDYMKTRELILSLENAQPKECSDCLCNHPVVKEGVHDLFSVQT